MPDKEKDLTWLLDILKGLGAVAGSLTSLALLFVIIGYTIVLSFIQEMKLYGLANFPREFFMEADIQFFSDLGVFFGKRFFLGPCIFLLTLFISMLLVVNSQRRSIRKSVFLILTTLAVLFTFMLGRLPEYIDIKDIQEFILYSVSMPILIALIVYLVLNISQIAHPRDLGKNAYLFFIVLFLLLVLSIPISYGRYIYDLDVYGISAFDYEIEKYKNDSLKEMKENIAKGGPELYYIMGHTAGKEIFFIASSSPKEMVIFDREAVNFIRVIRNESGTTQTLRHILSAPLPAEKIGNKVTNSEKKQLESLFEKIEKKKR